MSSEHKPPRGPLRWLEKFCDPFLIEGISGDLEELFFENIKTKGVFKARFIFWFHSFGFIRLVFKRKNRKMNNMKSIWINYLLTSYRSLKRHKVFFTINLIGLITAITCALFATIYINDELQFESQHSQNENIYRLYKRHINPAEDVDHLTWETSGMMGPTMKEEYAQVDDITRVCPWFYDAVLSFEKNHIACEKLYYADSNFFEFFDYKIFVGDKKTMLTAPSSMVISNQLAKSLFGDNNPIGESIIGLHDLE